MSQQDEQQRLEGAAGALKPLRQGQADTVAGKQGAAFLRLHEVEEELRRSQEYFQALAEQIPDVVWFVETDPLRVTYISRAFEEVWGMPCERVYADPDAWTESLDPEDRPRVQAAFASFVQGTRPAYHEEYRIIRPDGEVRWISDKAVAIRDGQGRVTRAGGISADITDVKEAQQQLSAATQRLQALMHALPVGVTFSEDTTCQHITANPTAMEQFEVSAEDNLSASALDSTAPGRQVRYFQAGRELRDVELPLQRAVKENRSIPPEELEILLPSGRRWLAQASASPVRDVQGTVIGGVAVTVDITERKQVEATLQHSHDELEQRVQARTAELVQTIDQLEREIGRRELAEKALRERTKKLEGLNVELERRTRQLRALAVELSQMEDSERHRLADMLHDDLQQILVGIRYQLDLIRWRIGEDRQTTEIVDQIGELVSQAIGRSRSLSHELSPPMLRQKGLLSAIKWLSDYMKDQHGLAVELVLSKDAEPASELLRSFLYKAARELLFNVVKHAGVQEARLELQRAGRSLRLTVRDEGMGFDPESLLSGAGEEGTGLLNIQERLELMGGHLDVDSKPGAGSTFEITLLDEPGPRGDMAEDTMVQMGTADRNRLRASQRLSMRAGRTPLRVLLADDHRIMREGLASLLAEEGDLEIVGQVDNGEQAIEQARKLRPDVIVMDISMPVMDGIEATRIIKGESPGIRIVGLSMYEQADLTQDMLEAGAEVQLSKAGPSAELLRAIRGSHS